MNQDAVQSSKSRFSRILISGCLVLLAALLFACLPLVLLPLSHAATATPGQTTASCAVTYIQLHGNNPPTVTCMQKQVKGAHPNINTDPTCDESTSFMLVYNNGNSVLCFTGLGYYSSGQAGVSGWYNVTDLVGGVPDDLACTEGWVRAYKTPGNGSYPQWNYGSIS